MRKAKHIRARVRGRILKCAFVCVRGETHHFGEEKRKREIRERKRARLTTLPNVGFVRLLINPAGGGVDRKPLEGGRGGEGENSSWWCTFVGIVLRADFVLFLERETGVVLCGVVTGLGAFLLDLATGELAADRRGFLALLCTLGD